MFYSKHEFIDPPYNQISEQKPTWFLIHRTERVSITMGSKKLTIRRRTEAVQKNISQQRTQNIYWQTTKTIYLFISQKTENASITMGSKK